MLGNDTQVLGNDNGPLVLGIMSHSGFCRNLYYVTFRVMSFGIMLFGIMSFGIMSHSELCHSA